ncbi:MAG: ABC-type amino acid transport system, permease component [Candidatus Midichloria mitochondrii]|uniref:Putative glutamine transport system permease protein GlnP n=1 Tax=Midichloria mitochondrii (strain IricVA) TaxID=696127 RepID=F7XW04_MIDMI|nr:amino acid ABC transporter permease [Candidatus Midichloria mitochondrii]AEI88853.1 glutamine transport system permease protein GlnP [Candidatus Midichloria mitochondrii IricVA]MDJ1256855.1 amino acid ABC transporter permease [Candidatus Midichloria mitochondrii]MDJ1288587.1 amino acid ABC transporter permease [Candidatus Midichloria mitochondrii]MDJ1299402.1 amino acid ABC transporter permease [Candidatus Midichloria mitochondrii]MDJ1313499.1 amino acid ABC transporter permease [Candidatus
MNGWYLYILSGIVVTLKYAFFAAIVGISFGSILAIARISENILLKNISRLYISLIRGTPLMVQLSIIYFGISGVFEVRISPTVAGLVAFSMNSSAYIAEVVRGGILAIDKGQFEAAKALSIPHYLTMKDIIIPQVFRNISPSLVNEVISLIKESAIIAIIGESDIMRRAQLAASATYDFFKPLLFAALCYYVLVLVLSIIAKYMEDKINANYK